MKWSSLLLALALLAAPAAQAEPHAAVSVYWDDRGSLIASWTGPGCLWLVGGPAKDIVVERGCGAGGSVTLGGGGDAAYQPQQHAALEWRPWGDGAPVRVAVPAYRVWLPVGVG